MIPVILAGGNGTRLWPLSRTSCPKQFLPLNGELSLLQQTLARVNGLCEAQPVIVCQEEHRFLVAEQLRQMNIRAVIILEPQSRNTAAAIALAALYIVSQTENSGDQMLVLSADHAVDNTAEFQQTIRLLSEQKPAESVGIPGVLPDRAATEYGYIRVADDCTDKLFPVTAFTEKPPADIAGQYLQSGNYYWNSGIFLLTAEYYLQCLRQYREDIYQACKSACANLASDGDFIRINKETFTDCPAESIDYAIMEPLAAEQRNTIYMAALNCGWSDIGSWSALWDIGNKDSNGNVIRNARITADSDVITVDSHNCFISADDRLITLLGVDDLIIADTRDALLVAHKNSAQYVKILAEKFVPQKLTREHRTTWRPWGRYECLTSTETSVSGDHYLVKRVVIHAGQSLSLQQHEQRAEHWVVVSGTAEVTCGDKTFLLQENESTFIPVGEKHRLRNPGAETLELIEVQSGKQISEEDIIRFEDDYGRLK